MQFNLFKGDRPSNGARNLQEALNATMLKSTDSRYSGRRESCVINWGCTNEEAQRLATVAANAGRKFYNHPNAVKNAVDKLVFFNLMQEHAPANTIPWVDNYPAALALVDIGSRVYARTVLNSHSGKGIVLMVNAQDAERQVIRTIRDGGLLPVFTIHEDAAPQAVNSCRLFTQGITGKRTEFRLHVFDGRVILRQVKLRKADYATNPNYNSIVRNLASSWVYGVNDVPELGMAESEAAALAAVNALGLDFGGVDIVYKHDTQQAFVLEVNTAPGLDEDGSALTAYTEAFRNV